MKTFVIDHVSAVPPCRQLSRHLENQIRSGSIKPNAKLPSVRQMAARYSLSRTTVSKVLDQLKMQGMLVGRQGAGVFVSAEAACRSPVRTRRELWVQSMNLAPERHTRLLNRFASRCPNVRVIESPVSTDILLLDLDFVPQHADQLEDVTDLALEAYGRSEAGADLFDPLRINGGLLVMPLFVNAQVVACNVDVFERFDVPLPSPEWDWDEFLRAGRACSRPSERVFGTLVLPQWDALVPVVWQAGGAIFSADGDKCLLDSRPAAEAGRFLRAQGAFSFPWPVSSIDKAVALFAEGKVAMAATGVGGYNLLNRTKCPWVARPLPRAVSQVTRIYARGCGLSKRCAFPQLARELIRERAGEEARPEQAAHLCGLPLHKHLERDGETERTFRDALKRGRTWLSDICPERRRQAHMLALGAITRRINALVSGSDPVERILRALTTEIDNLISVREEEFMQ